MGLQETLKRIEKGEIKEFQIIPKKDSYLNYHISKNELFLDKLNIEKWENTWNFSERVMLNSNDFYKLFGFFNNDDFDIVEL